MPQDEPRPKVMGRGGPDKGDIEDAALMQEKQWVMKILFRDDGLVRPSLLWRFHEEIKALRLTVQAMVASDQKLMELLAEIQAGQKKQAERMEQWQEKQAGAKPAPGSWLGAKRERAE